MLVTFVTAKPVQVVGDEEIGGGAAAPAASDGAEEEPGFSREELPTRFAKRPVVAAATQEQGGCSVFSAVGAEAMTPRSVAVSIGVDCDEPGTKFVTEPREPVGSPTVPAPGPAAAGS